MLENYEERSVYEWLAKLLFLVCVLIKTVHTTLQARPCSERLRGDQQWKLLGSPACIPPASTGR